MIFGLDFGGSSNMLTPYQKRNPLTTYQELNIGGQRIDLGIDRQLRVVDIMGNHLSGLGVPKCGIMLSENDLRHTIMRKISLN
jgi:hypothetical protein